MNAVIVNTAAVIAYLIIGTIVVRTARRLVNPPPNLARDLDNDGVIGLAVILWPWVALALVLWQAARIVGHAVRR
jgi:hypothetical protein